MGEKIATRNAYGQALAELANQHPEIVCFDADLAGATMSKFFLEAHPDRFFDMGIAEANMQGVAAGMCMVLELAQKAGLVPESVVQRQKTLIRNAGLPESYDFDREAVYQALFSDKKALGGKLRFVITPETGKAEIVTFQPELIREYLGI